MPFTVPDNPYLDALVATCRDGTTADCRDELVATFGFAVPDEKALATIAAHAPHGVVELGAGTGYWAKLLHDRGVDIVAYDLAPPPSPANRWFAGREPWFPVQQADELIVDEHPTRTLLIVWPTRNENWAARAAELHLANGGHRLVYVGQEPGAGPATPGSTRCSDSAAGASPASTVS